MPHLCHPHDARRGRRALRTRIRRAASEEDWQFTLLWERVKGNRAAWASGVVGRTHLLDGEAGVPAVEDLEQNLALTLWRELTPCLLHLAKGDLASTDPDHVRLLEASASVSQAIRSAV